MPSIRQSNVLVKGSTPIRVPVVMSVPSFENLAQGVLEVVCFVR